MIWRPGSLLRGCALRPIDITQVSSSPFMLPMMSATSSSPSSSSAIMVVSSPSPIIFDGLVDLDIVLGLGNDSLYLLGIGFLERHQLLGLYRLWCWHRCAKAAVQRERLARAKPAPRRQRLLMIAIADRRAIALGPHSRGWTGGRVDALLGVEGATVGASVWLRGAGGLSLTCELGPTTAALCASWVALDRLERAVNGLVR